MSSVPPTGEPVSLDDLRVRYRELCDYVNSVNIRIAPLKKQLEEANKTAENARVYATEIAKQVNEARGGARWFVLKKEIGLLAKALGGY